MHSKERPIHRFVILFQFCWRKSLNCESWSTGECLHYARIFLKLRLCILYLSESVHIKKSTWYSLFSTNRNGPIPCWWMSCRSASQTFGSRALQKRRFDTVNKTLEMSYFMYCLAQIIRLPILTFDVGGPDFGFMTLSTSFGMLQL